MSHILAIPKVNPTASAKETEPYPDEIIQNDGFFPDLSLRAVRNTMRIDGTVTNDRLRHAVIEAMITVNHDLGVFAGNAKNNQKYALEAVNQGEINGENVMIYRYQRAVFALATAQLMERYRNFDSTKEGNDKANELLDTAADLRRDYHFAVRQILGENQVISELI
ncbi:phage head protein [Pasteurellaceae bacterium Macca]|nr:phage head protein [Pasteurellaceae bacterium Macca]